MAAVVSLGVLAPAAAWDEDELPDVGIPWGVATRAERPNLIMSMEDVYALAKPCEAPPVPEPRDAGNGTGYQIPVRIKLSDGAQLAGFSPEAFHHGQFPWALTAGFEGWAVGYVNVPSLSIDIDPADVRICSGGSVVSANAGDQPDGSPDWAERGAVTRPDGSRFVAIPGTLYEAYYGPNGDPPRLELRDFAVSEFSTRVAAATDDGRLSVESTLKSALSIEFQYANGVRRPCAATLDGQLLSQPRTPRVPDEPPLYGGTRLGIPPAPDKIYRQSSPLGGAVEGGSGVLGTNTVTMSIGGTWALCRALPLNFFGFDRTGVTHFGQYGAFPSSASGPVVAPPGIADLSVRMVIDSLGLPKGLPEGYGFS